MNAVDRFVTAGYGCSGVEAAGTSESGASAGMVYSTGGGGGAAAEPRNVGCSVVGCVTSEAKTVRSLYVLPLKASDGGCVSSNTVPPIADLSGFAFA